MARSVGVVLWLGLGAYVKVNLSRGICLRGNHEVTDGIFRYCLLVPFLRQPAQRSLAVGVLYEREGF